jgi:hypothetical protein
VIADVGDRIAIAGVQSFVGGENRPNPLQPFRHPLLRAIEYRFDSGANSRDGFAGLGLGELRDSLDPVDGFEKILHVFAQFAKQCDDARFTAGTFGRARG